MKNKHLIIIGVVIAAALLVFSMMPSKMERCERGLRAEIAASAQGWILEIPDAGIQAEIDRVIKEECQKRLGD